MVRIAVVEDEAVSRQLLADYLARYSEENGVSFEVTYFEDGGAIIGDYKPVYDIILMDIQMTHVDGMTAARAIREVDQEVVLVFITSAAQFAIHGYQVGALSYLMKPLPWFAFSQELSRCLEAVAKRRGASMTPPSASSNWRCSVRGRWWLSGSTTGSTAASTLTPVGASRRLSHTPYETAGVKSIQWTARKYGGQAVTDVADHWFTLTVLLPSTNAQEDS